MEYPGTLLKRGSTGPAVKMVQARLGVQPTAKYGETTEECVSKFQRAQGLTVDGEVGPQTWAALFREERLPTDLGERALVIARGYVGQQEKPLGSNRGPFVDMLNREIGVGPGSFWCMSFVQHCVMEAAEALRIANPLKRTASCSVLYAWAVSGGRLVTRPEVGDIFLCIGGDTGHYHTGFVAGQVIGELFPTIEGNSNSNGSANGVEVAARKPGRRVSSCHYVRL